jgi:tRNA-modifying protein YgfZ
MVMPDIPYYDTAYRSSLAFDLSSFGKLHFRGKDRAAFLQNFTTNDIVKPGISSGCEAFLLTAQAKIVAWLRVALREEYLDVNMEPELASKVKAHLERYIIGEEVEIEDRSETDFLWLLCQSDIAQLALWQSAPWQNTGLFMQRCDFLGMPAAFVAGPRSELSKAQEVLGNIPLLSTEDPLWKTLRLEAGTPLFGIDFDDTNLPQEINRTEQAISFTKGCYIGQETVARIRAYGHVNRQLKRVSLVETANPSWYGSSVQFNGKEVGKLKTVAYSPKESKWLAFALLRKEHLTAGTTLAVVQDNISLGTATVLS